MVFQPVRQPAPASWHAAVPLRGRQSRRSAPCLAYRLAAVSAQVTGDVVTAKEETFDQVAAIFPLDDHKEFFVRSNDPGSGLAIVYTRNPERAERLTGRQECGIVAVNAQRFAGAYPFGWMEAAGAVCKGSKRGPAENLEPECVCFANLKSGAR
ncbi:aldehyde dehydrogenase family protein [Bradyrhizobium sp. RDI18]|uniref:aldehyde dehydrogenase family protein n=1 Tax=Bradyrhizobium sp. RDI18 TaxID=3367400 RepID=UPI003715D531